VRIHIDHATTYAYDRAARFIIQTLRLTPRSTEAQQVRHWRVETDVDARLRKSEDAFGNIVHTLYTEQPTQTLTVRVSGEVVTSDTAGIVPAGQETLPPLVFLRDTPLTRADKAMRGFAKLAAGEGSSLERLHRLMSAVNQRIAFEIGVTDAGHTAAEAFALGRGVCQDHAQIFIACARAVGIPARYVSGHLCRSDGVIEQEAAHAWAEAWVEDLGWVGFDPANGVCPHERYVRIAGGLDSLGAAPIRGTSYGGGPGMLSVKLSVRPVQQQPQQ